MPEILVCDRTEAACMKPFDKPWAVISVLNPGMTPVEFPSDNCKGVLRLFFEDYDRIPPESAGQFVLFNEEMAKQVWQFVDSLWEEVDVILVHCLMGVSRSPAIAAAVSKVKLGDDMIWFKTKTPNRRVYRWLLTLKMGQNTELPDHAY